jgi:uncharacterized protein YbaR (Trm112 family)
MKKELMEIICCPVCKTDLDLNVTSQENNEIIEGQLTCKKCKVDYPIHGGIPNLLPIESNK